MRTKLYTLSFLFLFIPATSFAYEDTFSLAIMNVSGLIKTFTVLAYSLSFLAFFWGFVKYLSTSSDEARKEAVSVMATSVAIIFIITTVWGVVKLVQGTLAITDSKPGDIRVPTVIPNY